jgi:phosphohistidine swiveling domain-containing protein
LSGFKDAYVAVFTAVQDILQKQKQLQQVILDKDATEIDSADKLPLAIITMDETKATPTEGTVGYELKVPIVVVAVIVEYEKENWLRLE